MRWRQIKPPRHIGLLDLSYPDPIGSSSAADAWVFGAYYRGDALLTYSLHWHDGRWDLRRLPSNAFVFATADFGRADAWAFGQLGLGPHAVPYNRRFDGTGWHRTRLPGAPREVSALSANDLWAVGPSAATLGDPVSQRVNLAMHWDGRSWTSIRVPMPSLGRTGLLPARIAAAGPDDLWLSYVSGWRNGANVPAGLLHWNGSTWTRLSLPPSLQYSVSSLAKDGQHGLFVAGIYTLYHYSDGQWTKQELPSSHGKKMQVYGLAWVPGTTSDVGVGQYRDHGAIIRSG
jgi:hypothetical protein